MESEHILMVLGGLIFMVIMGLAMFFDYQKAELKSGKSTQKVLAATQLVNAKADELSKLVDSGGGYIQLGRMTSTDPWNNPLGVAYSRTKQGVEELEVRSAGPDGTFETDDDIATQRWQLVGD